MIDFLEVSKFFGGEPILDATNLRINAGDRVGVVGPNGAGKSTMFSLLTGELAPDRGTISLPRDLRIAHLRQQLPASANMKRSLLDFTADAIPEIAKMQAELHELEHRLHAAELDDDEQDAILRRHGKLQSAIEQLGAYMLRTEAEAALSCLGFRPEDMGRPLSSFSGGWQMRAALARVIIARPDLLMLDEPSNYLDIPAVEYLCRALKSFKGTLLLISHDRFLLRKLTNLTLEVNNGAITRYAGDYDYYRTEREHRRRSQEAAKRNQDRKKDHMEKLIDRFRAKSSKAAQAKSWQKALDRLEEIELPDELGFSGAIRFPAPPPCGTPTAEIEDLAFAYPGAPRLLSDVNLRVDRGDKIAFVGYNGMGKTTLLKLLVGKLQPAAGRIRFGHQVQIGYQAQEFSEVLTPEQSVFDTVRAALPPGASQANLMSVLGSFGFSGDAADKRCGVLSGGEKIRLSFARIFVNPPNLLVLDEPTTHLDINARELLQEALRTYPGTVCLVSHDIEFVRNTANIIVAMEAASVRKYFGNYDYYLEKSAAAATGSETKKADASADQSKERRRERARRRNELSKAKEHAAKQVAALESKLEKLETRQQELVAMLSGSEAAPDFAKLSRELSTIQLDIQHVMYDWELAAEKLEAIRRENERIHQD
jgi:ATP-binding cassette subfamily F protein 3